MKRALLWAALAWFALAACRDGTKDPGLDGRIRLGHLANVTHAQALTGVASGRFAAALGSGIELSPKVFNAGPALVEALYAGEIDMAYVGPSPAINAYVRSSGSAVRLLAGAAVGGARFVVRDASAIARPEDLHRKRLASPQIGNSQDVSLRVWLRRHGLQTSDRGGDVLVLPVANADILALMSRGELDGAWVPEPWAARLVAETPSHTFLDERDLWPDGAFPSTVLIARRAFADAHPDLVGRFLAVHRAETRWHLEHPEEGRAAVNAALAAITRKPLPAATLADAMAHLALTTTVARPALEEMAKAASELGYLPSADLSGF
jgi:NitT/TauT family transport system substrate-binding protein